jgi:hydrogenase maturation protease
MARGNDAGADRSAPVVVIGVGNPLRGDDGAGPAVAARLRGRVPPGVELRVLAGDSAELIEAWAGRRLALIADAVRSGAAPGTVHRIEAADGELPGLQPGSSTHGLGLAEALALARVLGRMPGAVVVFGIEGECFEQGREPGPAVLRGVEQAARRILAEIGESPYL